MGFMVNGLIPYGEISGVTQRSPESSPRPYWKWGRTRRVRGGEVSVEASSAEGLDPALLALKMAKGGLSPQRHTVSRSLEGQGQTLFEKLQKEAHAYGHLEFTQ